MHSCTLFCSCRYAGAERTERPPGACLAPVRVRAAHIDADGPGGEDQDRGQRPLSREERVQKMWEEYYRKQANQRRAALQRVLHRSSALCMLANALLLDQAANDSMLQVGVAVFSLCTN